MPTPLVNGRGESTARRKHQAEGLSTRRAVGAEPTPIERQDVRDLHGIGQQYQRGVDEIHRGIASIVYASTPLVVTKRGRGAAERIGYVRAAGIMETDAALATGRIVEDEREVSRQSKIKNTKGRNA
jgi:hypothetical protein